MLRLIPDLELNGLAINSVVSAYSDMETYDILRKKCGSLIAKNE